MRDLTKYCMRLYSYHGYTCINQPFKIGSAFIDMHLIDVIKLEKNTLTVFANIDKYDEQYLILFANTHFSHLVMNRTGLCSFYSETFRQRTAQTLIMHNTQKHFLFTLIGMH